MTACGRSRRPPPWRLGASAGVWGKSSAQARQASPLQKDDCWLDDTPRSHHDHTEQLKSHLTTLLFGAHLSSSFSEWLVLRQLIAMDLTPGGGMLHLFRGSSKRPSQGSMIIICNGLLRGQGPCQTLSGLARKADHYSPLSLTFLAGPTKFPCHDRCGCSLHAVVGMIYRYCTRHWKSRRHLCPLMLKAATIQLAKRTSTVDTSLASPDSSCEGI